MGIRLTGLRAIPRRHVDQKHYESQNYWRQVCAQVGCDGATAVQRKMLEAGFYVAMATVANFLSGRSIPDLRTRVAFCRAFSISDALKLEIYEYGIDRDEDLRDEGPNVE